MREVLGVPYLSSNVMNLPLSSAVAHAVMSLESCMLMNPQAEAILVVTSPQEGASVVIESVLLYKILFPTLKNQRVLAASTQNAHQSFRAPQTRHAIFARSISRT